MSENIKKLKFALKALIYLQILVLTVSFLFISKDFSLAGAFLGKFAIYIFWIIALIGVIKRFKVKGLLNKINLVLLPNRRQLGILMFFQVLTHYFWLKGFDIILYGMPNFIPTFQIFGMTALLLLLPLFLTSNDWSQKRLGKYWQTLHYLVYPIMFLLVLHTSMQGFDFKLFGLNFGLEYVLFYGVPSFVILCIQLYSHYYSYRKKLSLKNT
jgi:DMSO/TMAO reductase YedYZ heme-binding membrane subunit